MTIQEFINRGYKSWNILTQIINEKKGGSNLDQS